MNIDPNEADMIIESVKQNKEKVAEELKQLNHNYQILNRLERKLKGDKEDKKE